MVINYRSSTQTTTKDNTANTKEILQKPRQGECVQAPSPRPMEKV
jgi:hypothetical protein